MYTSLNSTLQMICQNIIDEFVDNVITTEYGRFLNMVRTKLIVIISAQLLRDYLSFLVYFVGQLLFLFHLIKSKR